MSVLSAAMAKIRRNGRWEAVGAPPFPADPAPWVRHEDWLALPEITPGDQIFAGLFAVFEGNPNYVALVAEGDYTVDWGDGTTEDFDGGETAEHDYDYDTFDVAEETLSTRGYKQAVIVVTPQEGSDLTGIERMQSSGLEVVHAWLDMALNGPAITVCGLVYLHAGTALNGVPLLEHFYLGQNAIATADSMFAGDQYGDCGRIQSLEIIELNSADQCGYICGAQTSLRSIVLPNLPLCVTLYEAFYGCTALEKSVIGDAPLLSDPGYVYEGCSALKQAQHGNWGTAVGGFVEFVGTFEGCPAFTHLTHGDIDLANSDLSNLFNGAGSPLYLKFRDFIGDGTLRFDAMGIDNYYLLAYIGMRDLPDIVSLENVCIDLEGLRIFEMRDAPNCENFNYSWQGCALQSWTGGDMSAALTMDNAFDPAGYGNGPKRLVLGNFPNCTSFYGLCDYASGMEEFVIGDVLGDSDFGGMFEHGFNLRKITVGNILGTTFPTDLFASAPALQEIVVGDGLDVTSMADAFKALPCAIRKITIGDFPAATSFEEAFENDTIEEVVAGDTGASESFVSAFSYWDNNGALRTAPLVDTAAATALTSLFDEQHALRVLPALDFSSATDLTNFVRNCYALSWCDAFGARVSHSYADCNFGVDGLVNVFENLGENPRGPVSQAPATGGTGYAVGDTGTFAGTNVSYEIASETGGVPDSWGITAGDDLFYVGQDLVAISGGSQPGTGVGFTATVTELSTPPTVTVTGNPGTPYLTATQKAIAEDKGWTVAA